MFVWVDVHLMETGLLKKNPVLALVVYILSFCSLCFMGEIDGGFWFFVRYGSKAGE